MKRDAVEAEVRELSEQADYATKFVMFSEIVERFLIKAITIAALMLLIFQSLLLHDGFRKAVSNVEQAEGARLNDVNPHP